MENNMGSDRSPLGQEEKILRCTLDGSIIMTDKAIYAYETDAALPSLSDDDIDRFISDPSLIGSHEQAMQVIDALDDEIANIHAQINAAQFEADLRPLSPDRLDWLKRASYAGAMKRNERHRVMQRDKEIRGIKLWGGTPKDPTKKEANLLKQQRLADEAASRKLTKQNEYLALQNEREALAQRRREFQAQFDILRDALRRAKSRLEEEGYQTDYIDAAFSSLRAKPGSS